MSRLKYGTGLGNIHTPGWGQYRSISSLSFSLTLAWVLQAADVLLQDSLLRFPLSGVLRGHN